MLGIESAVVMVDDRPRQRIFHPGAILVRLGRGTPWGRLCQLGLSA